METTENTWEDEICPDCHQDGDSCRCDSWTGEDDDDEF